jgi:hypothetical protein
MLSIYEYTPCTNSSLTLLLDSYVAILYERSVPIVTPRSFTLLVLLQGSLYCVL